MDCHREALELQMLPVVQFADAVSFWMNCHIPDGHQKTTRETFIPKMHSESPSNVVKTPPAKLDGSFRMDGWRRYRDLMEAQSK